LEAWENPGDSHRLWRPQTGVNEYDTRFIEAINNDLKLLEAMEVV